MSDYDVVVIGSGFGGSVAALRLAEKGYQVAVLEAGARFEDKDFPKTSWRIRKFLFAPRFGLKGIQRIHKLPDVFILCGAGVGGGTYPDGVHPVAGSLAVKVMVPDITKAND